MQGRRRLRLLTARYWRDLWRLFALDETPEHAREIRHEQCCILSNTVLLYTLLGASSSTLFIFGIDSRPSTLLILQWVFLNFLYLCLIVNKITWQRDGTDDTQFMSRSIYLFLALGCTWGTIIFRFALEDDFITDGVLLEISMGLVSTPIIGVPLSAAFAFFLPASFFCIFVIFTELHTVEDVAKFSFVGFILFAASGIIYINKILIERAISGLNLERQNETISVFLREYETNSPDWLWETNRSGALQNIDAKMRKVFQNCRAEIEGSRFSDLGFENEDPARPPIDEMIRNNQPFRDHVVMTRQNGQKLFFNITGHPTHDGKGHFQGFRGVSSNITEKKKAESRVHFMANYDDLTKVMNRHAFLKTLQTHCEAGIPFTFLLIDVDRFKLVNDRFGHEVGNIMLRMIVKRIKKACFPSRLIGRLGGDEFTLILPSSDRQSAITFCHKLVESFNQEFQIDHIVIQPSVSIGIAFFPEDGRSTERLFHHADLALYHAKNHRNSFSVFNPEMEEDYFKRVKLKADLENAIKNREFFLEYQPIFDTTTANVVSAEALIRWKHPEHGILSAKKFIQTIEDNGLVDEIGDYTLQMACQEAVTWPGHLPIAVNVSPSQLRSGKFVSVVSACLKETGLSPSRLGLEVTESTFLAAEPHTLNQLRDLRALGVRLILDDFGTGYSSLTYLCEFDVDGIKIDASFMANVTTKQKVTAIVRTIARLAADMNVYVVAEGIEHENQLIWLQLNGIPFAQGYYLSRPMPSPDIRQFLSDDRAPHKIYAVNPHKPPPGTTRH